MLVISCYFGGAVPKIGRIPREMLKRFLWFGRTAIRHVHAIIVLTGVPDFFDNPLKKIDMDNELTTTQAFELSSAGQQLKVFETQQRIAMALSKSTMVPKEYQGNVANCYIALDVAQRMTISVLTVMQNLNVIHGKPSWSSTFLIASINATGDYQPLEYDFCGESGTDSYGCRLVAYAKSDTERVHPIYGEWVTIGIAKAEGWYDRSGSKWRTMPGQMLRYRAAAWWQRAYRPELSLGFLTTEEVREIVDVPAKVISTRRHRLAEIAAHAVQVVNNNDNNDNNTNDDNDGAEDI